MALQEITVTTNNFGLVKGLVLVHLLLHEVLHDAGVEVSALLLVWCVYLFGVIHQEFWACFLEWLVSASSYSCRSAYLRLIAIEIAPLRTYVGRRCCLVTNTRFPGRGRCGGVLLLRLPELWHLVDQYHFSKLCGILQSLELWVE